MAELLHLHQLLPEYRQMCWVKDPLLVVGGLWNLERSELVLAQV
jgi:hypothetical protein